MTFDKRMVRFKRLIEVISFLSASSGALTSRSKGDPKRAMLESFQSYFFPFNILPSVLVKLSGNREKDFERPTRRGLCSLETARQTDWAEPVESATGRTHGRTDGHARS